MKILNYKKHSKEELIKKLRKVILLNSEKRKPIFVYKNSLIGLKKVESSNQLVLNLYKIFKKKYNQDIFNMSGYVTYSSNDKSYTFVPPIIEYIENSKGNT